MFKFVCSFLSFFFVVSAGAWSAQQEALWKTPEDVYQFVVFSKKAYENFDALERDQTLRLFYENGRNNDTSYCGFVTHVTLRDPNTQAITTDAIVVAFHGTRTGADYFLHDVRIDLRVRGDDGGYAREIAPADGNFWDTPIAPGEEAFWVHPGFAEQVISCAFGAQGFEQAVEATLRAHPCQEIIFTGHSMGAAMAQLAALLYYKRNWQVFHGQNRIKVFAFSSPAIFNSSARKIYDQSVGGVNSIHFYVNGDIINLVPLYHAGIPVKLDFSSRPTAILAGARLLWSLKGAILGAALAGPNDLWGALKETVNVALAAHTVDDFTRTDIEKAMEKIQGNFLKNPDMGFGLLGK